MQGRPAPRWSDLGRLVALALVLVLSQTWGLLHGVVHGGSNGPGPTAQWRPAAAPIAASAPGTEDSFNAVFGHPDSPADCRLYDQLSRGDVLPGVVALALPLVLQPFILSVLSGLAVARWHAQFQARGPPPAP